MSVWGILGTRVSEYPGTRRVCTYNTLLSVTLGGSLEREGNDDESYAIAASATELQ